MNSPDFWSILNSAQVSTALVLIAFSLVYIAFRFFGGEVSVKSSKTMSR